MKACYLVAEAQIKLNLLQVDSKHVRATAMLGCPHF